MPRHDAHAIRMALADPREVARALGLQFIPQRDGVMVRCPAHADHSPSLSLRAFDNGIGGACQSAGCGFRCDLFSLIQRLDGCDFKTALERAAELAGGAYRAPAARDEPPAPPTMPGEAFHETATYLLQLGRLDGPYGAAVSRYLRGRGLLEEAAEDGWAALPPLAVVLRELGYDAAEGLGLVRTDARTGEVRASWDRHLLVIPWRGEDGRIGTLQRRIIAGRDKRTYVRTPGRGVPGPYGVERLGKLFHASERQEAPSIMEDCAAGSPGSAAKCSPKYSGSVLWVEGAVDVLAARALARRPVIVLGIPGGNGWVTAWRRYAADRESLYGTDNDERKLPHARPGDLFAATIALDVAELLIGELEGRRRKLAFGERRTAFAVIDRDEEHKRITPEEAVRRRAALGPLACVLCDAPAGWLCEGCGRRRPRGAKDWGEVWANRRTAERGVRA